MSSQETEVAVLFADVVGSTRLYEVLGDNDARELIVVCLDVMRTATERNRGSVIKTIGDEILAIFPTADDAINAASEMHQDFGGNPALVVGGNHVMIRVGCHFGPVVLQNKDIFGAAVATANRMTSQAKAGQIVITGDTVQRLHREWQAVARRIDVTSVRGIAEELELFEVLWQQEDATSMLPSIEIDARKAQRARRLRVRYLGRDFVVDDIKQEFTMGRAEDNDIIALGPLVSRLHAKIEVSRDKFTLIDQSTNGTFVTREGSKEAFVRRDSTVLLGQGYIGLGKMPDPKAHDAIAYRLDD